MFVLKEIALGVALIVGPIAFIGILAWIWGPLALIVPMGSAFLFLCWLLGRAFVSYR